MNTLSSAASGTRAITSAVVATLLLGGTGCSGDQAPKSWSALSTCLAGDAAPTALASRIKQLRLIQLNNSPALEPKNAWPGACMKYANDLHTALDSSGKPAILRRKLEEKLACSEGKSSCRLDNDEAFIPTTTVLWEAARDAELPTTIAAGVTKPTPATEPPITLQSWKPLSEKPQRTDGPWLAPDGRALVLVKNPEGQGKPTGCEFAKGFGKIHCKAPHPTVPELPLQTVQLVAEPSAIWVTGLLESGLLAYNLETGKTSGVRGSVGRPLVNGLAVETEVVPEPKAPPKPSKRRKGGNSPEPTAAPPGVVAIPIKDGQAGPAVKLPTKMPTTKPFGLSGHAIWVEADGEAARLVIKSVAGGRLHDVGDFKGNFKGASHTCEGEATVGLAFWDRKTNLASAKPSGGPGKTLLTVTQLHGRTWSKPIETSIPFERLAESELHCTKDGVSVVFATRADEVLEIGRVDCTADACKSSSTKLAGIDSKWWWLLSPVGDNVMMVWRSRLGETRFRVAQLSALASTADNVLFDTGDYGGPNNTDASSVVSSEGALLLFRDERPVALRISRDGTFGILAP